MVQLVEKQTLTAPLGVVCTLSGDQHSALEKIEHWHGWGTIQQVAKREYHIPAKRFWALLPEYERYLAFVVLGYSGMGMFSRKVDELWHSHQLYTELYDEFCFSIFGFRLQHRPNLEKKSPRKTSCTHDCTGECSTCKDCEAAASTEVSPASYFVSAYQQAFGTLPPPIWGLEVAEGFCSAVTRQCDHDCDCDNEPPPGICEAVASKRLLTVSVRNAGYCCTPYSLHCKPQPQNHLFVGSRCNQRCIYPPKPPSGCRGCNVQSAAQPTNTEVRLVTAKADCTRHCDSYCSPE